MWRVRTPWRRLYDALVRSHTPPQSFTSGVEWGRAEPPDDGLTEDMIIADQPDWIPPEPARLDRWRPRTTLDP
jgi:hypothetical protein